MAGWNTGSQIPLDSNVHPDNHAMAWVPGGGVNNYQLLVGNDGGVYLSDPGVSGGTWTGLNSNLVITEFYKGAIDVTGSNVLALGGAQDDFTVVYTGSNSWDMTSPGDGGDCAISATAPIDHWATSFQITTDDPVFNTVEITHTLNGGLPYGDFANVASDISDALPFSSEFTVHFEKAPYNDDLFIAGTATLWRCDNFFQATPSWVSNSPTMTDTNGVPVPISAMAFAPSKQTAWSMPLGPKTDSCRSRVTEAGNGRIWTRPGSCPGVTSAVWPSALSILAFFTWHCPGSTKAHRVTPVIFSRPPTRSPPSRPGRIQSPGGFAEQLPGDIHVKREQHPHLVDLAVDLHIVRMVHKRLPSTQGTPDLR